MSRLSIAFLVACMALPASAQQGGSARSKDSTWAPPTYSLDSAATPSGTNAAGIKQAGGQTQSCTPSYTKVSESQCNAGSKVVTYANSCGGQNQANEKCASGTWSWMWRNLGGGDGWMNTSSIIKAVCVEKDTFNPIPYSSCGPMPASPSPCLVGYSSISNLPACADFVGGQIKFPPNPSAFWAAADPSQCTMGGC